MKKISISLIFSVLVGLSTATAQTIADGQRYTRNEEFEKAEQVYKDLIALRKSREALIEGGLRWIHVEDDLVVYLRESKNETLLIAAARNAAKASIDVSRFGFTKSQPILGQVHTAEGALLQLDFPRASFAIWSLA